MSKSYRLVDRIDESGLLLCKFYGVLNMPALRPLLEDLQEIEVKHPQGFDRFTDLAEIEEVALQTKDIRRVSEMRQHAYRGPAVRSAIYAVQPYMFGLARMYGSMMHPSPIEVNVYYSLLESAEFLGQKPELLLIDPPK